MIVSVTQEHIDQGVRGDCSKCAIALAIKDIPEFKNEQVEVDGGIHIGGQAYYMPDRAIDFITRYDAGLRCVPFTFELQEIERW